MSRDDEVGGLPDLTIEVVDHSLSASELDAFAADYTPSTCATVTVHFQWGGPWASGMGVDIAVVVVATSLLSGFMGAMAADAYAQVKGFVARVLPMIKTDPEETRGFYSPLAIAFESRRVPLRIEFLLPRDGHGQVSTEATIDEIFGVAASELSEWEARLESELRSDDMLVQIRLARDEDSGIWNEFEILDHNPPRP